MGLNVVTVIGPGLEHLKGLAQLQLLDLSGTQITNAGLEHLKGLTNVQMLYLKNTKVSDAGLEHLKGLTNLQMLDLSNTEVTDWSVGLPSPSRPSRANRDRRWTTWLQQPSRKPAAKSATRELGIEAEQMFELTDWRTSSDNTSIAGVAIVMVPDGSGQVRYKRAQSRCGRSS